MEEKRVKTIMLLSDGYDNDYDTEEIVDEIKKITKGQHLSFTLHTFGYGDDFDSKLMSKLALIRDGSFFSVEDINKIQDYFVNALGGCMSTIYNEVKINIKMLKDTYKFIKIYGQDKLYNFESKNNELSFGIIQVISGKEYTYTFEVELPEIIQINENIFEVEMTGDNDEKIIEMGKYKIVGGSFSIADEEYLKNKLYETLAEAMLLIEKKEIEKMNSLLNNMKDWIVKNYDGINKNSYLKKLNEAMGYFQDNNTYKHIGRTRITADIYENQLRRGGIYSNSMQMNMICSIPQKKSK
jgi:DNA-binding protein YbaB